MALFNKKALENYLKTGEYTLQATEDVRHDEEKTSVKIERYLALDASPIDPEFEEKHPRGNSGNKGQFRKSEKTLAKLDEADAAVGSAPVPKLDKSKLSNYVKRGDGELGRFSVPGAEEGTKGWITGYSKDGSDGQYHLNLSKVWNPKEGFDGTEFGREMLVHAANNFCDKMEDAGVKVDRRQIVADFSSSNETYNIGELISRVGRGNFEKAMRKLGYDGFVALSDDGIVTAFDPAAVVRAK